MSVWNKSACCLFNCVIVPLYNGRSLRLTVHHDWLSRAVSHVRVLTAIFTRSVYYYQWATLAVNNDDGSNWEWLRDYLSALNMQSDCFFLILVTLWQIIHCSLQTKTNKKAVLCRETTRYRCKIRQLPKFAAASRGSLNNITALVYSKLASCIGADFMGPEGLEPPPPIFWPRGSSSQRAPQ